VLGLPDRRLRRAKAGARIGFGFYFQYSKLGGRSNIPGDSPLRRRIHRRAAGRRQVSPATGPMFKGFPHAARQHGAAAQQGPRRAVRVAIASRKCPGPATQEMFPPTNSASSRAKSRILALKRLGAFSRGPTFEPISKEVLVVKSARAGASGPIRTEFIWTPAAQGACALRPALGPAFQGLGRACSAVVRACLARWPAAAAEGPVPGAAACLPTSRRAFNRPPSTMSGLRNIPRSSSSASSFPMTAARRSAFAVGNCPPG